MNKIIETTSMVCKGILVLFLVFCPVLNLAIGFSIMICYDSESEYPKAQVFGFISLVVAILEIIIFTNF